MLKKDKGVTLLMLVVTIVVLIILISVSVYTGTTVMTDVRISRILSNMTMVQAKVETIKEKAEFYGDTDYLEGTPIGTMNNFFGSTGISDRELQIIAENAGVSIDDVKNSWNWYQWDRETLTSQGLDKSMLNEASDEKEEDYFYVNYEYAEIIYSRGSSYDKSELFYSMSGLHYLNSLP